ncbi:MAG: cytochrome-c peroxidase [Burkholderiales bacterium]
MQINSLLRNIGRIAIAGLSAIALCVGFLDASISQESEPIRPIPTEMNLDARKVALGEQLFNDRRISKDGTVSCASCHDLKKGGTDRAPVSIGAGGVKGIINSPTVFNAALNFRQHWDGRAATLEDQITVALEAPRAMATTWPEAIGKLNRDPALVASFKEIYRDGLVQKNVQDAIATFERSLITPNARFDKYLRGDKSAITAEELRGYQLFKSYGCVACHQGVNIGGNMYQRFGVMSTYFNPDGTVNTADLGRFNVTKNEADRHVFKVPSLRNVALTAPYFHNASAATLEEAVDVMIRFQLGRSVPDEHRSLIIKFLHTLTGEYRGAPL